MNKYNLNLVNYELHSQVFNTIEKNRDKSILVLDVGCATGYFAKKLQEKNCRVWGIEIDQKAAKKAAKYCEKVVVGDIDEMDSLPFNKNFFDYILILDTLEHLVDPKKALKLVIPYLKKTGKIIISVPNSAHIFIRTNLLFGKFNYEKQGLMDETHLHFFTKKTILEIVKMANLNIVDLDYSADFGQIPILGKFLKKIPKKYQYIVTCILNTLLAVQFILICQKKKQK